MSLELATYWSRLDISRKLTNLVALLQYIGHFTKFESSPPIWSVCACERNAHCGGIWFGDVPKKSTKQVRY